MEAAPDPNKLLGMQAVLAAHPEHPGLLALQSLATDVKFERSEFTVTVPKSDIVAACAAAKSAGYNFFEDATAVDWYPSEPRFQVSYHLLSHSLRARIRLVARLSSDDLTIDSIIPVWPSANFYEREIFDLFGITINNHPNLKRIMMPDDWVGHPLRKDYPVEGYR